MRRDRRISDARILVRRFGASCAPNSSVEHRRRTIAARTCACSTKQEVEMRATRSRHAPAVSRTRSGNPAWSSRRRVADARGLVHVERRPWARTKRRGVHVQAVFEMFTERSVKAVMLAQEEAKALGLKQVRVGETSPKGNDGSIRIYDEG